MSKQLQHFKPGDRVKVAGHPPLMILQLGMFTLLDADGQQVPAASYIYTDAKEYQYVRGDVVCVDLENGVHRVFPANTPATQLP